MEKSLINQKQTDELLANISHILGRPEEEKT